MIESVVHVLGISYKNTIDEQWSQACGEDMKFLLQISSFGCQWLITGFKKSNTNSRLSGRHGGELIPGRNRYVRQQTQRVLRCLYQVYAST
jgi:hypothetical protein